MYATRTVVFLTSEGILTPLVIKFSLPPSNTSSAKQSYVFIPPPFDSTKNWVWELAKANFALVDMSYHEVISHL